PLTRVVGFRSYNTPGPRFSVAGAWGWGGGGPPPRRPPDRAATSRPLHHPPAHHESHAGQLRAHLPGLWLPPPRRPHERRHIGRGQLLSRRIPSGPRSLSASVLLP